MKGYSNTEIQDNRIMVSPIKRYLVKIKKYTYRKKNSFSFFDAMTTIACMVFLRFLGEFLNENQFFRSQFTHKVPLHAPHFVMLAMVWIALRLIMKQPI